MVDVNTYAVFAELMRNLGGPAAVSGCIVPTGIATDDTTKHFFQAIVDSQALISLYEFENQKRLYAGVGPGDKFGLLSWPVTAGTCQWLSSFSSTVQSTQRRLGEGSPSPPMTSHCSIPTPERALCSLPAATRS